MNRLIQTVGAVALAATTFACDDSPTAGSGGENVTVAFTAAAGADLSASPAGLHASSSPDEIVVTGENGVLTITDVAFIVAEFELEAETAACEDDDIEVDVDLGGDDDLDDDGCEEFESELYFVQLPLAGGTVPVVTEVVPAGTYTEMEFEVEDADLDEAEDDDDADRIAALIAAIEAAGYTEWPDNASLVVAGTFTPTTGEPRDFVTYFDAEIEIEMEFEPPLTIESEGGTIEIEVDPAGWFVGLDGNVTDLSQYDYATTGTVLEFEVEMEDGFTEIELDGFDD